MVPAGLPLAPSGCLESRKDERFVGECCGDVLMVLVPIKSIDSVEVYPDAAALQKAIADQKIRLFTGPEALGGMEVR